MMQSTESGEGVDRAISPISDRGGPTTWRVLREFEMGSVLVVITDVLRHEPVEMPLIQDDHVVQEVSSATPDPALRDPVLPRTAKRSSGCLASQVSHRRNYIRSEF
jgi:hypothetical protein